LSSDGEIEKAANMRLIDYEQVRADIAKRLNMRKSAFDTAVTAKRKALGHGDEDEQGAGPASLGPEPWDTPVTDIATVLDTASKEIRRYVVASATICDTAALWALFTHFVHHAFIYLPIAPQLAIKAVSPVAGKTTLLQLIRHLVWRPLNASSLTAALVYRVMDAMLPTFMLDECDVLLRSAKHEELLAILRSAHNRQSANVPRLVPVGDGTWKPEMFSAWCSYAYTTVRDIEAALQSRAIDLVLLRAKPEELRQLFRLKNGHSEVLSECGRKFARWATDQTALPENTVPAGVDYRDCDNWLPLLQIAVLAGRDWPERAAYAARTINGITVAVGDVVPLLADIRTVFGTKDRLSTEELVAGLLALAEPSADWTVIYRGRPINAYYLREHLKGLVDPPKEERRWKAGSMAVRGYLRRHFNDAFERYLPQEDDNLDEQGKATKTTFSPIYPRKTSDASDTVTETRPNSKVSEDRFGPDAAKGDPTPSDTNPTQQADEPENQQPEIEKLSVSPVEDDTEPEEWSEEPAP
jgi:putative DNA primase/helicase